MRTDSWTDRRARTETRTERQTCAHITTHSAQTFYDSRVNMGTAIIDTQNMCIFISRSLQVVAKKKTKNPPTSIPHTPPQTPKNAHPQSASFITNFERDREKKLHYEQQSQENLRHPVGPEC